METREQQFMDHAEQATKEGYFLDEVSFDAGWQAALESQPKWIPISERLPEKDGQYLVYKPQWNAFILTYNSIHECWDAKEKECKDEAIEFAEWVHTHTEKVEGFDGDTLYQKWKEETLCQEDTLITTNTKLVKSLKK